MSKTEHVLSLGEKRLLERAIQARNNKNYREALGYVNPLLTQLQRFEPAVFEAAMILFETNNFAHAENILQGLLNSPFQAHKKFHALAVINKVKRNFTKAIHYYLQTIKLLPDSIIDLLGLSFCYAQLGQFNDAIELCSKQLNDKASERLLRDYLGSLYIQSNNMCQAEAVFNDLIQEHGESSKWLYSLATIYKASGNIAAAKNYYERSIVLDPGFTMAHYGLSAVTNYQKEGSEHLNMMEKLYCKLLPNTPEKMHLAFALSKALEQQEKFSKSFDYLKEGNNCKFRSFHYEVKSDLHFMESVKSCFTRHSVSVLQKFGSTSQRPIFIIGMPRSGTTLVEKILSSHSDVQNGGELDTAFKIGCSFLDQKEFLFKNLAGVGKNEISRAIEHYLGKLAQVSSKARFVTDKLPINFLMVGVIKILFPKAIIIHCKRHSLDTCLSIYKKNFSNENYRFAYNLKTLGEYYKGYEDVMSHWHREFPGEIIDVNYENLAMNPSAEIPKLVDKCGLTWEKNCLEFYKTPGIVQTASAAQVRQPMYTNTIDLWQQYQEELSELINILNP